MATSEDSACSRPPSKCFTIIASNGASHSITATSPYAKNPMCAQSGWSRRFQRHNQRLHAWAGCFYNVYISRHTLANIVLCVEKHELSIPAAIVGLYEDEAMFARLEKAFAPKGIRVIKPDIAPELKPEADCVK